VAEISLLFLSQFSAFFSFFFALLPRTGRGRVGGCITFFCRREPIWEREKESKARHLDSLLTTWAMVPRGSLSLLVGFFVCKIGLGKATWEYRLIMAGYATKNEEHWHEG